MIRSAVEQDLVYNYLKKTNFANNVWIGLTKINNSFKVIDGSISNYLNWNTGRPTKISGADCVEMAVDFQGKWVDVKCEKKNAVLCEKKQEWSNSKIEIILQELRKNYSDKFASLENKFEEKFETQKKESQGIKNEIAHMKQSTEYKVTSLENKIGSQNKKIQSQLNEIAQLKQNPVPIGFIYAQLSGQSEPHTLWPNTQWDNVSKNYSGLFFRAEGGESNVFGKIQEHQTQTIEFQDSRCNPIDCITTIPGDVNFIKNSLKITNQYPPRTLWTGSFVEDNSGIGIRFKYNSEEIRPRNQAIRIWIRIK